MKLVILDRDGVINQDLGHYVTCPSAFVFNEGVVEAIALLKRHGYLVAIATNQAGIERGFYTHQTLAAIHHRMLQTIRQGGGDIDRIIYCPSYDDNHPWRKPNAGMLREILDGYGIQATDAVFIGDTVRDMQAGDCVDCQLIMVKTGKGLTEYPLLPTPLRDKVRLATHLLQACEWLVDRNAVD